MAVKTDVIRDFLETKRDGAGFLEHEIKGFLKELGLPVPKGVFTDRERLPIPIRLNYPLVAKVSSTKITSKSDVNGIRLGIGDGDELKSAVAELLKIEHAEGVIIEEMAPHGLEVITGGVIDRQFGPVVMFGLGGVFVELFKDVAFAIPPLGREEALWLVRQVKGHRLLEGYRGGPAVDTDALLKILESVSEIMETGLVEEIDLNPVVLYPEGAIILDAKLLKRRA